MAKRRTKPRAPKSQRRRASKKAWQTRRELDALGIFEPKYRKEYAALSRKERELFFELFLAEVDAPAVVFTVREYKWQKWTYEYRINVTATDLFEFDEIEGMSERFAKARMRDVLRTVRSRYMNARLYGGTLLYKRSSDGKKWDKEIIMLYLTWRDEFAQAEREAVSKAGGFYLSMTNPEKFEHAYRVKLVGVAGRAMLRRSKTAFEEAKFPKLKGIKSLSRQERIRRQLRLL